MARSVTNYLLSSSLLIGAACASYHPDLKPIQADQACLQKFKPKFTADWYKASIDVREHHLSGLLFFKTMPDKSTRVVFTNEVGITFFDFEFAADGTFTLHQAIKQLDRKPVIQVLKKDMELILMQKINSPMKSYLGENEIWYAFKDDKETTYFVTDQSCTKLVQVETASARKKKIDLISFGEPNLPPDSLHLQHYNFTMHINLKRLPK